jgi:transposase
MIGPPQGVRVFLACKPVDMRKGMTGLSMVVQEALGQDPLCGALFVFRGKRATLMKVLCWDGSGWALYAKRNVIGMILV